MGYPLKGDSKNIISSLFILFIKSFKLMFFKVLSFFSFLLLILSFSLLLLIRLVSKVPLFNFKIKFDRGIAGKLNINPFIIFSIGYIL